MVYTWCKSSPKSKIEEKAVFDWFLSKYEESTSSKDVITKRELYREFVAFADIDVCVQNTGSWFTLFISYVMKCIKENISKYVLVKTDKGSKEVKKFTNLRKKENGMILDKSWFWKKRDIFGWFLRVAWFLRYEIKTV